MVKPKPKEEVKQNNTIKTDNNKSTDNDTLQNNINIKIDLTEKPKPKPKSKRKKLPIEVPVGSTPPTGSLSSIAPRKLGAGYMASEINTQPNFIPNIPNMMQIQPPPQQLQITYPPQIPQQQAPQQDTTIAGLLPPPSIAPYQPLIDNSFIPLRPLSAPSRFPQSQQPVLPSSLSSSPEVLLTPEQQMRLRGMPISRPPPPPPMGMSPEETIPTVSIGNEQVPISDIKQNTVLSDLQKKIAQAQLKAKKAVPIPPPPPPPPQETDTVFLLAKPKKKLITYIDGRKFEQLDDGNLKEVRPGRNPSVFSRIGGKLQELMTFHAYQSKLQDEKQKITNAVLADAVSQIPSLSLNKLVKEPIGPKPTIPRPTLLPKQPLAPRGERPTSIDNTNLTLSPEEQLQSLLIEREQAIQFKDNPAYNELPESYSSDFYSPSPTGTGLKFPSAQTSARLQQEEDARKAQEDLKKKEMNTLLERTINDPAKGLRDALNIIQSQPLPPELSPLTPLTPLSDTTRPSRPTPPVPSRPSPPVPVIAEEGQYEPDITLTNLTTSPPEVPAEVSPEEIKKPKYKPVPPPRRDKPIQISPQTTFKDRFNSVKESIAFDMKLQEEQRLNREVQQAIGESDVTYSSRRNSARDIIAQKLSDEEDKRIKQIDAVLGQPKEVFTPAPIVQLSELEGETVTSPFVDKLKKNIGIQRLKEHLMGNYTATEMRARSPIFAKVEEHINELRAKGVISEDEIAKLFEKEQRIIKGIDTYATIPNAEIEEQITSFDLPVQEKPLSSQSQEITPLSSIELTESSPPSKLKSRLLANIAQRPKSAFLSPQTPTSPIEDVIKKVETFSNPETISRPTSPEEKELFDKQSSQMAVAKVYLNKLNNEKLKSLPIRLKSIINLKEREKEFIKQIKDARIIPRNNRYYNDGEILRIIYVSYAKQNNISLT